MQMTLNQRSSQLGRSISSAKARMSHAAPFNTTSIRKIWKKDMNPGVGQYEIIQNFTKSNLITENQLQNIVVYQLPNNSSSFKSSTRRFNCFADQKPGPGDYNIDFNKTQVINKKSKKQASKLMHYLSEQYKKTYELAPQNLQINQGQAEKEDKKINIKKQFRNGSPAFTSKAQRNIFQRPITPAGPGSYEINNSCFTQKKTYQKSPQSNQRTICNNQNLNKLKAENLGESFQNIILNLSNFQQAVGPGYYEQQTEKTMIKKSFSKGIECFGSKVPRFKKKTLPSNHQLPGPGFYQSIQKQNCKKDLKDHNKQKKSNKGVGFGSSSAKQFKVVNNSQLCPFSYNITNDFSQLLRQNYLRGSVGNFGSTQQRFLNKNGKEQENMKQSLEWKQFLNINSKCKDHEVQGIPIKKVKKCYPKSAKNRALSRRKQHIIEKKQQQENDQRPLCYDNIFKTIGSKFSIKTQSDSPFFSKVQRFKTQQKLTLLQQVAIFRNAKNGGSIHKKQMAKNSKPQRAIHKFRS